VTRGASGLYKILLRGFSNGVHSWLGMVFAKVDQQKETKKPIGGGVWSLILSK